MRKLPLIAVSLAALLAAVPTPAGSSGSPFPIRMVKLGGAPDDPKTLDHLRFSAEHGFNAVWVYSQHAGRWDAERAPTGPVVDPAFLDLARWCRERGLRIFLSVNPVADTGGRFRFSAPEDERRLRRFLRLLHRQAGIHDFVLSFDDQPTELTDLRDIFRYGFSAAPAHLDLARRLFRRSPGNGSRFLCASAYSDAHLGNGTGPYSRPFLEGLRDLPPRIGIVWTGTQVASEKITAEDLRVTRARLGGRQILLYDNYPVNDDEEHLALALNLGPLRGRDPELSGEVAAYLACPMAQLAASRLSLLTIASYLADPAGYDPETSWREARESLAGPEPHAREALETQALEWGGWIGTLNYRHAETERPDAVARRLDDPAYVASWEWTADRYPGRMAMLTAVRDEAFLRELLEVMSMRLAVARAIPVVIELIARRRAGRGDLEPLLSELREQRHQAASSTAVVRALDRFLSESGIALGEVRTPGTNPP